MYRLQPFPQGSDNCVEYVQLQAYLQSQGCNDSGVHEAGAWPSRKPQSSPRHAARNFLQHSTISFAGLHMVTPVKLYQLCQHGVAALCRFELLPAGMLSSFSSSSLGVACLPNPQLAAQHQHCATLSSTQNQRPAHTLRQSPLQGLRHPHAHTPAI